MLYDSNYIWHAGKGKGMEAVKKNQYLPETGREGMNRWTTKDFEGSEMILYATVVGTFVKTHIALSCFFSH